MNINERIISNIKKILDIKIDSLDIKYINQLINNYNNSEIKSTNELILLCTSNFIEYYNNKIKTKKNEPDIIDTHELMKQEIGTLEENDEVHNPAYETNNIFNQDANIFVDDRVNLSKLLNANNLYDFTKIFNPNALLKKTYIVFDTRFVSSVNPERTKFTWNFMNNSDTTLGSINALGPIRDIVSIRVYKFNLPGFIKTPSFRVSINFEEFQAQSFIGHENRRFHILAITKELIRDNYVEIPILSNTVISTPTTYDYRTRMYMEEPMNYGVFHFRKPVTIIDKLTLSFGDPYNLISIPNDMYICTQVFFNLVFSSIYVYMYLPELTPLLSQISNSSLYINIVDFTTSNPVADSRIINVMNSLTFRFVNVDLSIPPYNLEASLPISNNNPYITPPPLPVGTPSEFKVYITNFRTFIYTEMTYISSDNQ